MAGPDMGPDQFKVLRWSRWALAILGLLCMVAGVIVLAEPKNSLASIAVIIGVYLTIDGIITVLSSLLLSGADGRALTVLMGVVGIVIGVILIRHPVNSVTAVAMFVGLWLIVAGAVRLVSAFGERQGRVWRLLVSLVEIVAGIVIVSTPGIGIATLALLIGIGLILRGIALSTVGWLVHQAAKDEELPAQGPVAAT